jgi:MFS family permease
LDWRGALLLIVSFSSLIGGLSHLHEWGPFSGRMGLAALLCVAATAALAWVETHTPYPLFAPSLLKIRLFVWPVAGATLLFISLFFITFLMPFYMVHPLAFSMNRVGATMMIPFVFVFFFAPVSGTLSDRLGSRMLCTVGMILLTAALLFLSRLSAGSTFVDMAWRLALAGIGIAVFISPNSAAALSAVPPRHRGIASGAVATARNLGMVIGVALAGLIFNSTFRQLSGGHDLKLYTPALAPVFMAAFQRAMLAGAAVAGLGIVVAFLRGRDRGRSDS